jgi:hypothetical protein
MGNRRMGLGRMEALLEQIDRDLNLTNSTLTAPTIVNAVSIDCAGALVVDTTSTLTGNITTAGHLIGAQRGEIVRQSAAAGWNDGDYALTVGQSGAIILLDKNEATAVTLPAVTAADIGITYLFVETVASALDRTINTKYDNDYWVGGVANLPTAAENGAKVFVAAGATDVQITFDDNLANGAGALGSWVRVTAVLTGNTGAGGGAKLVWLVEGTMGTADPNGDGTAIFT